MIATHNATRCRDRVPENTRKQESRHKSRHHVATDRPNPILFYSLTPFSQGLKLFENELPDKMFKETTKWMDRSTNLHE